MIADDAELVSRIGAHSVAEVAPNRYWRSRVIETALADSLAAADQLREAFPPEWLWAVSRLGDSKYLPAALSLLRENSADADLVNRVLLCVMHLGNRDAIDEALAAAKAILDQPPPSEPD